MLHLLNNQKGMAIIMVLSTIIFIIVLVQETVFETQIEYRAAIHELDSLRAYHAAKSGMEVNLLRVKTYQKITSRYAKQIEPVRSYLDLIWKFPFQWPLPLLDTNISLTNKTKSLMDSQFITFIKPTASKIDINDLASPIPSLRKWTFKMLYNLIVNLQKTSKIFTENNKLSEKQIITLLYNIQDWVDPNTQQQQQPLLSESILYTHKDLPHNHSFINLEELHQVANMSDIIYDSLAPFITVYGEKGLDINTAPVELLQALHSQVSIKLAQEIVSLTQNPLQPFVFTQNSFSQFLNQKNLEELNLYLFPKEDQNRDIPISYLYFNAQHNFHMESVGIAGKSQKTLVATYFNTAFINQRFQQLIKKEKRRELKKIKAQTNSQRVIPIRPPTRALPVPHQNNAPIIIYWKESL